jgi:hypothetical protein
VIILAKFKISIDGNIAEINRRFKHGIYETDDPKEIDILKSMKTCFVTEIIETPKMIENIDIPIMLSNEDKNEVKLIGKHRHSTR